MHVLEQELEQAQFLFLGFGKRLVWESQVGEGDVWVPCGVVLEEGVGV